MDRRTSINRTVDRVLKRTADRSGPGSDQRQIGPVLIYSPGSGQSIAVSHLRNLRYILGHQAAKKNFTRIESNKKPGRGKGRNAPRLIPMRVQALSVKLPLDHGTRQCMAMVDEGLSG